MEDSISQVVHEAGKKISEMTDCLADTLNQTLNHLLSQPFYATEGFAVDAEGQKSDIFSTIIYTSSQAQPTLETLNCDADNLACVINIDENLDIDKLRTAYERIASAKRLKKAPSSNASYTTVTLGIIFARDATVPLESLAKKIDDLNRQHPDHEWTDMVVVLSKGIINYACQFPGEHVSGDFLPPAYGATFSYSPPMYVIIVVRPTGRFTFNKMFSFIVAHLMIFSPDARLPNWSDILEGTPKEVMVITGYQYNLSGKLIPVPREFYNDRYIPPKPFLIEDQQGKLLSTLRFLPWQDGGVVLLKGKLPLDGLLIFLGKKAFERGGIIKRDDGQISYVIPITQSDFMQMLQNIQQQSNMIVKPDTTKLVSQKIADEGPSSPFIARLYIGIMQLRDTIFSDHDERLKFDKPYQFIMETMLNTRSISQEIIKLMDDHFSKLAKGEIGHLKGFTISIEKPIDKELRKEVESFVNSAVRILKLGMQEVTNILGKDISFLFKKQSSFENGIRILEKDDRELAVYLMETRKWSQELIDCRNNIEHNGWMLPKIKYDEASGIIQPYEPEISGKKLSNFVKFMMDRISCFVEEVTAHCLEAQMPDGITIREIPLLKRAPDMPIRFQVTLADSMIPVWNITYHQISFEET